jgi:hypothetical protein
MADFSRVVSHQLHGVPPVHQEEHGKLLLSLWLVDSGATMHITPFASDINPDTYMEVTMPVQTANGSRCPCIATGTVTITIRDETTGDTFAWQLFNAMVVPRLSRRLISTDELNRLNHEIHLKTVTDEFILHSPNKMNTLLTLPKCYELDPSTGKLSWPPNVLRQLTKQTAQFIICPLKILMAMSWNLMQLFLMRLLPTPLW